MIHPGVIRVLKYSGTILHPQTSDTLVLKTAETIGFISHISSHHYSD